MNERKNIEVPLAEVKELFEFLEEVNDLFHQPSKFQNSEKVAKFAEEKYPTIQNLYYKVVWEWLPDNEKQYYENK